MTERAASRRPEILMIGPPLGGRGGMSAVVAAYRDDGLLAREHVRYIQTTSGNGVLAKLGAAALAFVSVTAHLLRRRVTLLHAHVASGVSFWRKACFCWLAFLARCPVVLHIHGGNFLEFFQRSPHWARRFISATFARAAFVIVLSPAWVDRFAAIAGGARYVVVWNPVTGWPACPPRTDAPFVLLFLGRLERDKGVFDLVAAFAAAFADDADVVLHIGGDGDRAGVEKWARDLGVAERVKLLGWLEGEAKRDALAAASMLVLPSHVEGLPIAMLEAMHCSVPVITCPVGSIPEVVCDGRDALLVPPGDVQALAHAMRRLREDDSLRVAMGRAGRLLYEDRFDMATVGPIISRIYSEVAVQSLGSPVP